MGRGDFESIQSLQAVDRWIQVINSNLNASNRVGYKSSQVKFRGGVTDVVRNPQGALQGIQLPETTLQVDQTTLDFSQGSIINSEEVTHLAIQGQGFFRITDFSGASVFYTRDGEFHLSTGGYFVNSAGLYLREGGGLAVSMAGDGISVSLQTFLANAFGDNVVDTANRQGLVFSQYGATIFEAPAATVMNPAGATPRILSQALESSNSSLSQAIPELSLAQKFFTAVSKIISVHQTNLDTVINLVR